jgi:hypothetical protein
LGAGIMVVTTFAGSINNADAAGADDVALVVRQHFGRLPT